MANFGENWGGADMKILAVSDQVDDRLYTPDVREYLSDISLVLGCGDLPYAYLEFLVSALNKPLLYVPGNHDPRYDPRSPAHRADGCTFLDGRLARLKGLSIAGLGGSIRYHPHQDNQYTQVDMYLRLARLAPALLWERLRRGRPLDILIAHSPPRGIHDEDDPAHTGFSAFTQLIRRFAPRYFLHGHTIPLGNLASAVTQAGATMVINVFPYRLIEIV
jgi:Icc-related predicted phosphoesterase